MILLDYQDPRPIYEQIVEKYKLLMLRGVLQAGEQMPSVRSLAMELSTNPNTVQKAYAELERQGFLYTVKGRGNFVSGDESLKEVRKQELIDKIGAVLDEAEAIGISREEIWNALERRKL